MLAPEGVEVTVYAGLGDLPHFNPDLEDADLPSVKDLGAHIRAADGLLISSPEYAHGVPGVLKNALDWLVGGDAFYQKPIMLLNASPVSTYAQASLTEIITVMTGHIVSEASVTLPLRGKKLDAQGIATNREHAGAIRAALGVFIAAIQRAQADMANGKASSD